MKHVVHVHDAPELGPGMTRATCVCGWRSKSRIAHDAVWVAQAGRDHAHAARCGKVCFPTEQAARDALVQAKIAHSLRGNTGRREQRAYPCEACNAWHLTSSPSRATA